MGQRNASTAAAAPGQPAFAAREAETAMRKRLSKDPPPVDYKNGRISTKGTMSPLWQGLKRSGSCRLPPVTPANPFTTPAATLEDHYSYGQDFAVFNPCVSAAHTASAQLSTGSSSKHAPGAQWNSRTAVADFGADLGARHTDHNALFWNCRSRTPSCVSLGTLGAQSASRKQCCRATASGRGHAVFWGLMARSRSSAMA